MSGIRRKLKGKKPPAGFDLIEEVIEDFERQMKEAVTEDMADKRKAETTWKIHRIHWEKNRFIFDLMYKRKVMSKELFDWLVREKVADGALISKWRKPGYEILCSLSAINKGNTNFGTTSLCRVPLKNRPPKARIQPNNQTGCISCCSGDGKFGGPLWWNTPVEDEAEEGQEANRQVWAQRGGDEGQGGSDRDREGEGRGTKRGREEYEEEGGEEEDDIPEEVKRRIAMMREEMQRQGGGAEAGGPGEGPEDEDE